MLRGLPGGARRKPAREAPEQAIHGENLTGDESDATAVFYAGRRCSPSGRQELVPSGRPEAGPDEQARAGPAASLSRPLLTKRSSRSRWSASQDRLRRAWWREHGVRRPRRRAQTVSGTLAAASEGSSEAGVGRREPRSSPRVPGVGCVSSKGLRPTRLGRVLGVQEGAASAPPVPGGQLLCRLGYTEAQETKKHKHARKQTDKSTGNTHQKTRERPTGPSLDPWVTSPLSHCLLMAILCVLSRVSVAISRKMGWNASTPSSLEPETV